MRILRFLLSFKFIRLFIMSVIFLNGIMCVIFFGERLLSEYRWHSEIYLADFLMVLLSIPLALCPLLWSLNEKTNSYKRDIVRYANLFSQIPSLQTLTIAVLMTLGTTLLTYPLVNYWEVYRSACRLCIHAADLSKNYELAERLYTKLDDYGISFVVEKWCYHFEQDGMKADDTKFDEIVTRVYGAKSYEMGRRCSYLSERLAKKGELEKAEKYSCSAISIFSKLKYEFEELYEMQSLAKIRLKLRNYVGLKKVLRDVLQKTKFQATCFDEGFLQLATRCNDRLLETEFSSLSVKENPHPQRLKKSRTINHFHCINKYAILSAGILDIIFLLIFFSKFGIKIQISRLKNQFEHSAAPDKRMNLLSDIVALELFNKNYQAADHYSQRLLKLAEESA